MEPFMQNIASIKMRVQHGASMCPSKSYPFMMFKCGLLFNKLQDINKVFTFMESIEYLKAQNKLTDTLQGHLFSFMYENPTMFLKIEQIFSCLIRNQPINILIELQKLEECKQQYKKTNGFKSQANSNMQCESVKQNSQQQIEQQKLTRNGTVMMDSQKKENKQNEKQDENQSEKTEKYDDQYLENMIKMNMESEALAKKLQQEEENQAKQFNADQQILCQVCYVGLYDEQFIPLQNCEHIFHKNCLAQYFKAEISQNRFPLKCPSDKCGVQVKDSDIKMVLASQMYSKYEKHTLKHYADMHGDSISWCPTANCQYMFFFQKDDTARFQCLQCHKEYCLNCRVEWHRDMSCKQYQISNTHSREDEAFISFVKGKKFKQCPKCKFWVQKNEGCDHMTCKCKFQFCYKCGGVYMKCECVAKMQAEMQRRRQQVEQRRRKKMQQMQKRKNKIKEAAAAAASKQSAPERSRRKRK